jgi:predicted polyphosphate/ATP-dependent NAD kinase
VEIGIIANPAAGKDIRRLVAHATVIDNNEKVDIVKRIILASQSFGIERVYIMADAFYIGYKVIESLETIKKLKCDVEVINDHVTYSLEDTIKATQLLEEKNVDCILSLGGDGTNRAIAKVIGDTPLLPISTGTNNVYPEMVEGTIAGIVAAIVSKNIIHKDEFCSKDKIIEIYKNNQLIDIALIDVVISKEQFIGAKAIWNLSNISDIIVSRANPWSIGFSSIAGYIKTVNKEDNFGLYLDLKENNTMKKEVIAPVAPGILEKIQVSEIKKLNIDEEFPYQVKVPGTLALDGEREIEIKKGDNITFKITRNGPCRVDVKKALEWAQARDFFTEGSGF